MAVTGKPTRRQEYAEATRQAIEAARRLFAERGYFATKVDDIATEARVAPATVYAVTGGKSGLLSELVRIWTTDPIVGATLAHVGSSENPVAIIREVASTSRRMREEFADVMRVILTTAPHDETVADQLAGATRVYRSAFVPIAERLAALGGLRRGTDIAHAVDVLWFYFGYSSYFTLVDDNGWSYDQAERWLADQALRVLLPGVVVTAESDGLGRIEDPAIAMASTTDIPTGPAGPHASDLNWVTGETVPNLNAARTTEAVPPGAVASI